MIGWRKSSLLRQPITLPDSCFRFASREQIRLVENGLKAPKSQTPRAVYTRQWRENTYKSKRFNKLLKEYIELKYISLYNEYCAFFNSIDEQHPTAKDLTKTRTYRKWKEELLKHQESEPEDQQERNTLPTEADEPFTVSSEPEAGQSSIPIQLDCSEARIPPQQDILTPLVEDILSPDNQINANINQADNLIQEIIDDLERDDAVRDLINEMGNEELVHPLYEEHDEGIGLNLEDELDIEPFDFIEEVEGFDF